MTPAVDMEHAAALCGYSWERFRKVWRGLPGFPAPVKRPSLSGRGTYAWDPADVAAWLEARKRAFGAGGAELQAANDPAPQRAHVSAVQRQRAELARKMAAR